MTHFNRKLATITSILALSATCAAATDVRLTFGQPESYAIYDSYLHFADALGALDMPTRIFTSGSLLALGETTPGVRDGLADVGFVVLPYTPAEFSESILIANLSMLATTGDPIAVPGAAMNGATMEYILLDCPECLAQMAATNHVYTAGSSSQDYVLACTAPIRSLDDLQGKRIRVGAANFTRWAEFVGAIPVQMPGNETYDALSRGALDCTTIGLADFYGQHLNEVTNAVVLGAPGGVYAALGYADFNRDFWQALTEEQRVGVMHAAARASAESTLAYASFDGIGREAVEAAGTHEFIPVPADITARTAEFVTADMASIEQEMTERYAIQNAAEKLATARALVERWRGLTANITADDVDALTQLYWDEIYSHIDLTHYGME